MLDRSHEQTRASTNRIGLLGPCERFKSATFAFTSRSNWMYKMSLWYTHCVRVCVCEPTLRALVILWKIICSTIAGWVLQPFFWTNWTSQSILLFSSFIYIYFLDKLIWLNVIFMIQQIKMNAPSHMLLSVLALCLWLARFLFVVVWRWHCRPSCMCGCVVAGKLFLVSTLGATELSVHGMNCPFALARLCCT